MTTDQKELRDAYERCRAIALGHYENFPVASILLPKRVRPHVFALYAFMRTADDFADTPGRTKAERLVLLADWRRQLVLAAEPDVSQTAAPAIGPEHPKTHPIFLALRATLHRTKLPVSLLHKLLDAFEFDAHDNVRFETMEDLRWYTARSADPVGQIMLHLFGYQDEQLVRMSDDICTALQLINFIQDAKEDLEANRLYIPLDLCKQFSFETPEAILRDSAENTDENRSQRLLLEFARQTRTILQSGVPLLHGLSGRFKMEIRAVILGAVMMLRKIESPRMTDSQTNNRLSGSTIRARPVLTQRERRAILFGAVFGANIPGMTQHPRK